MKWGYLMDGWRGRALLASGLLLLATGCSSFNRDWNHRLSQPILRSELEGPWEGFWRSERNGHHGRLRCLVTHESGDAYAARFRATFWKWFRYSYTARIEAQPTNGGFQFVGEADLGWLAGGVYRYRGRVTGTNFHSTYESKDDHGVFQMARPLP